MAAARARIYLGIVLLALGMLGAAMATPAAAKPDRKAAAAPGKLFGFGGIRTRADFDPETTAALVAGVDGNSVRSVIHWQALEPERDRYRLAAFEPYDELYRALRARRIKPIFVLQFAPAWARDSGAPRACGAADACHYPPAVSMLGDWAQFVGDIARRYPAASIEVWNEPNYIGQWQSGVDPARYAQLLATADRAVAAVNRRQRVYAGGLGSALKPRSLSAPAFLRAAYAARPSLAGHTDAINVHIFPAHGLGPGSQFARFFASVRRVRDAAGDGRTPLLVSELGRTTSGPHGISLQGQAQLLPRAIARIKAMRDSLGVIVYTLAERNELAGADPERGFGLVRAGPGGLSTRFKPKPAYCALRVDAGYPRRLCRDLDAVKRARLRAAVRPRTAAVRPGQARRLLVFVRVRGAALTARRVSVCLRHSARAVALRSRRCRRVPAPPRGRGVKLRFRVGLRAGARGVKRLRFVAKARGAPRSVAKAKLRPRR